MIEIKLRKNEEKSQPKIYEVYHLTMIGSSMRYQAVHCDVLSGEKGRILGEFHVLTQDAQNRDLEWLADKVKLRYPINEGDVLRTKTKSSEDFEHVEPFEDSQLERFSTYLSS